MSETGRTSILWTALDIGSVRAANRFVRSATHDFMALDDGSVTDKQVELYRRLGQGEIGLIITGHAYVHLSGKAGPRQIGISDDQFIPGLARIAEAVHAYPSKIFVQLAHAGRQTKSKFCDCTPVSPSPVYDPSSGIMPRELTSSEIKDVIQEFVSAALRAKLAGFDGVQIHAAHGYLLSSFLSLRTNRRQDEWGGSLENRVRIILEIIRGIKEAVGSAFPVIAKLNATDFIEGGLAIEDSLAVAGLLETGGIDGIEISGGVAEAGRGSMWKGLRSVDQEGYFVADASRIKKAVRVPVFGLGGIRTFAAAEKFVASGEVDLISLSRPFIRDPGLLLKFRSGKLSKSDCLSCNKCLNPRGIRCAQENIKES